MPLDGLHVNLWKTDEVSYLQIHGNSTRGYRSSSSWPVSFFPPNMVLDTAGSNV